MSNRELRRQIGKQTLILGDCLVEMKKLPAASVDEIFTSPPYNIDVDYNQYDDRQRRDKFLADLSGCCVQGYRLLKSNGCFWLNFGTGTASDMTLPYAVLEVVLKAGFVLQDRYVWVKAIVIGDKPIGQYKPMNSARYSSRLFEDVFLFTKHGDVPLAKKAVGVPYADKSNLKSRSNKGEIREDAKERGTVLFAPYDTAQSKADKFNHPAGFPVELPTHFIKLQGSTRLSEKPPTPWFVRPNHVVLDPFAGTGTTLVAAHRLGCHGIGIEIDSQYVETAHKRLAAEPAPASLPVTTPAATPVHSRIGPSQAVLVLNCPGSVKAQEITGRPAAGEAAERGTELHKLAEDCLRTGARCTEPAVAPYVEAVRAAAMRAGVEPLIEQRLDLPRYHPELFGTLDSAVVDLAWGVLTIFDFKSGLIHVAADALQLKLYGGMALMTLPVADQRKIRFVDTVVVQPVNGSTEPVRRARHTVADILNTLSDYVDTAHVATDDSDPPLHAGPWCRGQFCAARASCPAFRTLTLREAQDEFTATEEGGDRS